MRYLSTSVATALLLTLGWSAPAQDPAAVDLKKSENGSAYEHPPSLSKYELKLPKDWEVVPPQMVGKTAFLGIRQPARNSGDPSIEITMSWSPLTVKMDTAVEQEIKLLGMLYSPEKVGKPDPITVNEKPGFKIPVDNGPTLNDKEAGVVYLFETGPDEKSRWKVKVRATVPKRVQAECLKTVDDLVKNLKW